MRSKAYEQDDINLIGKLLEGKAHSPPKNQNEPFQSSKTKYLREIPDRAVSAPIPDLYGLERVSRSQEEKLNSILAP